MDKGQAGTKVDIHSRITDEIIRAIEKGAGTYEMPWHGKAGSGLPRNPVTGNMYQGINTLALWAQSQNKGYGLPYWATYRQWQTLNANVRRREHGTSIVFYKPTTPGKEETANDETESNRSKLLLRYSTVFNAEQVEGWSIPPATDHAGDDTFALVEAFVKVVGADVRYGSDSAYYSPKHDRIYMPNWDRFVDTKAGCAAEGFYSVLLHEHIHWSGHGKRLKRDLSGRFGSQAYAVEELVAELGSAFLCATFGVSAQPRADHASYIDSWLAVFGKQKSALLVAASAASGACRYLEDLFNRNSVSAA